MTYQPNSHFNARAGAAALACLLMAAGPVYAQDGGAATQQPLADTISQSVDTEGAAPSGAAPAPAAAQDGPAANDDGEAPATQAAPQASNDEAAAPSAPTESTSTEPAGTESDTATSTAGESPTPAVSANPEPAAAVGADASDQPATPEAPATESPDLTDTSGNSGDAAAAEDSSFSDTLQRNLDTLLAQGERDPTLPHDLSPMGMFLAADWVVKAVMIGLAFASVITWTVLVVKMIELWLASGRVARARQRIENAADLPSALAATGNRRDPASRMVAQAMREYERSLPSLRGRAGDDGLKDRVASHLMQIEGQASRKISQGTGMLATIGSTAPFVGLFGTVWGIMNSFIGISQSQTTNLAVVAPGIAEALLATAIGLVAAIPAVIIYNVFARAITGYRLKLAAAGAGVQRLVSRDLDFRMEA